MKNTWGNQLLTLCFMFVLCIGASAQVKEYDFTAKGVQQASDELVLSKGIPVRGDGVISGKGKPKMLYVVQLARFEFMRGIPEEFPAGTFLWINPDLRDEKLLLSGFYESPEEAEKAAEEWKRKDKQFRTAFARTKPFMVIYQ